MQLVRSFSIAHRFHHATAQAQHQVQRALLLDVVVRKRAAVLQLLAGEDQTLLVRGNAFLVLDLLLDVLGRVRRLHVQRDGLACQRLDEDLHVAGLWMDSRNSLSAMDAMMCVVS